MNKFHYTTEAYLNEYGVENESYSPSCIPQVKYPQNYEKPDDLDLFVLVYDKNLGNEILQTHDVGGFYRHFGFDRTTNHFIVFCDCPNFTFSDPIWILTHELSHFSLFYLGSEKLIIENIVHSNDKSFDKCRQSWEANCNSIGYRLESGSMGNSLSVMPIYHSKVNENTAISNPQDVFDLNLELSKISLQWWASGKLLYSGEQPNNPQLLDLVNEFYNNNGNVEFADGPIKEETTWEGKLYGESEFDSNQIMHHIPFKQKSLNEINEELDDKLSHLPFWFTKTAVWWANDKVSDEEFFQSIDYLKEQGLIDVDYDFRFLIKN